MIWIKNMKKVYNLTQGSIVKNSLNKIKESILQNIKTASSQLKTTKKETFQCNNALHLMTNQTQKINNLNKKVKLNVIKI